MVCHPGPWKFAQIVSCWIDIEKNIKTGKSLIMNLTLFLRLSNVHLPLGLLLAILANTIARRSWSELFGVVYQIYRLMARPSDEFQSMVFGKSVNLNVFLSQYSTYDFIYFVRLSLASPNRNWFRLCVENRYFRKSSRLITSIFMTIWQNFACKRTNRKSLFCV